MAATIGWWLFGCGLGATITHGSDSMLRMAATEAENVCFLFLRSITFYFPDNGQVF
jgi:hypothetical protein